jgi:flagellar biosynthesis/type III secretory pathway M-ring protein FliF/YscJ
MSESDVELPESKRKLPAIRSSQDIVLHDVTQELESLAEHQPERLAEIVREWIKE